MNNKHKGNYHCKECNWNTLKWVGRCPNCHTWGNITETETTTTHTTTTKKNITQAQPIKQINTTQAQPWKTNISEINRVLGGGLVPGAVTLLTGEPGIGKSTLLLNLAAQNTKTTTQNTQHKKTLYITAEESVAQVHLRAQRINALTDHLYLTAETDLGKILGHIEQTKPQLLIVDSVQTVSSTEIDGNIGGINQVKEVTKTLIHTAKKHNIATILVGHVTKDGTIAGPRTLEHLVDTVCHFEGEQHNRLRILRSTKNRYGPTDEIGCFDLTEHGIISLPDPTKLFLSHTTQNTPGTCITVTLEGTRPLVAEVQSLVTQATTTQPRRATNGLDPSRVAMLIAVLQSRAKLPLGQLDTYVSTVGGVKITEPATDLATALAIASATANKSLNQTIAFGEIGLAGEIRPVSGINKRILEAARVGFTKAIIPKNYNEKLNIPKNFQIYETETLNQALKILQ